MAVETPHPRSSGIQCLDVYVETDGDSYFPRPYSPDNDCYVSPYRLRVTDGEFRGPKYVRDSASADWDANMRLGALRHYLKITFWGSRGYFLTKCLSLKMASKKKRTDRWHICEGSVPSGKGWDYVIDRSLLGEYAKPMDGANLTSVETLRLAGSKTHDAIEVMVQEYPHVQIIGSIFKKMATYEAIG